MNLLAVGDGGEKVEESADFWGLGGWVRRGGRWDVLSFAVFAFAVEDMKARERVMTSARPCAFLGDVGMRW